MNGKAAKRIRYAVKCRGIPTVKPQGSFLHMLVQSPLGHMSSLSSGCAETSPAKRRITQLKRAYKAQPYHRRDVHKESHGLVLQVLHGNATRRYPA